MLRCDYGTENCKLAAIQIALRYYHEDALAKEKSFLHGPSVHNIVSEPCQFGYIGKVILKSYLLIALCFPSNTLL